MFSFVPVQTNFILGFHHHFGQRNILREQCQDLEGASDCFQARERASFSGSVVQSVGHAAIHF